MLCFPATYEIRGWTSCGYPSDTHNYYQYVWGYSVINVSAAYLISSLSQKSRFDLLFAQESLVFIGKISYGIYVFHWPVQLLYRQWFPFRSYSPASLTGFALSSAVTITLAHLSFKYFESWFLRCKDAIRLPEGRLFDPPTQLAYLCTTGNPASEQMQVQKSGGIQ
jgi:peptidoglycan/LPS O-acetylase OafA/YrhL